MDAGTATVTAAGIAAWASVLVAVLHRTNGNGPLSKKIDAVKQDVCDVKADVRDLKADFRTHLQGDGR